MFTNSKDQEQSGLDALEDEDEEKLNNCVKPSLIKQNQLKKNTDNGQLQQQQQQISNEYINTTITPKDNSSFDTTVNYTKLVVNLFQWEQLVSKGISRPLLINDLDFTDLRDEDDADLMNANGANSNGNSKLVPSQTTTTTTTTNNNSNSSNLSNLTHDYAVDRNNNKNNKQLSSSTCAAPQNAPPPMPPFKQCSWSTDTTSSSSSSSSSSSDSRSNQSIPCSPSPPQPPPPPEPHHKEQPPHNLEYNSLDNQESDSSAYSSDYSSSKSIYSTAQENVLQASKNNGSKETNNSITPQPPPMMSSLRGASSMSSLLFGGGGVLGKNGNKRKKTMKLFWKEVREDRSLLSKLTRKKSIWDELKPVQLDTQRLEHLFESKAKEMSLSRSRVGLDTPLQRKVKINVLDAKRSNAINIGMTKLPPMRTIKSAILNMDSNLMNREGIEKILSTMMPTEEEKSRIIEAQLANPDTPLGTAEQFLLNLASISALEARLKLWAFQLDYAQIEKEVAEPLMDLKQAIEEIEKSETFRNVLATLLAIGNFLNSSNAKGFQIEYLEKVPEVKDTVHKHSLLHHLCLFIQEKYDPELAHDLYSEFSAVNRASKVDYAEVAKSLKKMQQDCKASWDYLKVVSKHDGLAILMNTSSSSNSTPSDDNSSSSITTAKPINSSNLSKDLSIDSKSGIESNSQASSDASKSSANSQKQLKTKVSDFLTDCAERILVLVVIHRRIMNRYQKLLVYLGSNQIKQTEPQQLLKVISEFAFEYRMKCERVREMMTKNYNQTQRQQAFSNRSWTLGRGRWAGSHQCIDSLSDAYVSPTSRFRPSSNISTCPSGDNGSFSSSICGVSLATGCDTLQHTHFNNRPNSPSCSSQISNFSDNQFDQSATQNSQPHTPSGRENFHDSRAYRLRRPELTSDPIFDFQNQQQQQQQQQHELSNSSGSRTAALQNGFSSSNGNEKSNASGDGGSGGSEQEQRLKDQQLRRLLGGGRKSLDESFNELLHLNHRSSGVARVMRHPPIFHGQAASVGRNASMEETSSKDNVNDNCKKTHDEDQADVTRQSSHYKHLHQNNGQLTKAASGNQEENSDDEILRSLVRTVTAKSIHQHRASNCVEDQGSLPQNKPTTASTGANSNSNPSSTPSNKTARNRLLSRINCDRKSIRRTFNSAVKLQIGSNS